MYPMNMNTQEIFLILWEVATLLCVCLAQLSNLSSDHMYSMEGRRFSYDTISSLDQNFTVEDCSIL